LVKLFNDLKKEGKVEGTAKDLCEKICEEVLKIGLIEKAYEANNG